MKLDKNILENANAINFFTDYHEFKEHLKYCHHGSKKVQITKKSNLDVLLII